MIYMEKRDNKGRILKTGESQRRDGRYDYRYIDERTGKRVTVYSNDLADLREKEREIRRAMEDGLNTTSEAKRATLNATFDHYMSFLQIEESTRIGYLGLWNRHVKDDIGRMRITDIKASHIKAFYADMTKEGYAWGTLKIIHGILCPLFEMAVEDDIILKNPAHGKLSGYGADPKERYALTVDEQERFLRYIKESSCYSKHLPLINFMIGTACRIGEVSGLTWDDLDMQDGEVMITHQLVYKNYGDGCRFHKEDPKTEAGVRNIPMTKVVRHALSEQRLQQFHMGINRDVEVEGLKGFVFTSKNGMPLAPNAINNVLKNIVDSYNHREEKLAESRGAKPKSLPHVSNHILRHTGCTRMAESGMDPKVLQYIMGHADISITMDVYNHVSGMDRVKKEMQRMDSSEPLNDVMSMA